MMQEPIFKSFLLLKRLSFSVLQHSQTLNFSKSYFRTNQQIALRVNILLKSCFT